MRIVDIYRELLPITDIIPSDFGGGSSIAKSTLMAYIAIKNNLKNYVEIGVYRGRSFFPMARAMQITGGKAFGIDPYSNLQACEADIAKDLKSLLDNFLEKTDFEQIFQDVISLQESFQMVNSTEIFRQTSKEAVEYFKINNIKIDMLHIDGNHDTAHVLEDIQLYLPLMADSGFIVVDDIDWASVKPAFNTLLRKRVKIKFITKTFCILKLCPDSERNFEVYSGDDKFYEVLYAFINKISSPKLNLPGPDPITISVILPTYNHEMFIEQAIISILAQEGTFLTELIVADDASTDLTRKIVDDCLSLMKKNESLSIKKLSFDVNLGLEKNYKRAFEACTGKYIAICEGDDFWSSPQKLSIQLDFMLNHPHCSFCFNNMYLLWNESDKIENIKEQTQLSDTELNTRGLIRNNYIGNFSCCFYDSDFITEIPESFYNLHFADWMFNILFSTYGQIGHIWDFLSVYRKHKGGFWSGKPSSLIAKELYKDIFSYNRFLNFEWDADFNYVQLWLHSTKLVEELVDLLILDDYFPDSHSEFRWHEFMTYLQVFDSSLIATVSDSRIGSDTFYDFEELLILFKRSHPEYSNRLTAFSPELNIKAKCCLLTFLNNAYRFIEFVEKVEAPFIFTLYPGGGFHLYDEESDNKLRRIFKSPFFKKVIVTQEITFDYLIQNSFCDPSQILKIFGGVIPPINLSDMDFQKTNYGKNKSTFDICFVAHRYTSQGLQKGYDIFIETARQLSKRHNNIYFHVVGGFDETVINVSEFKDRITFYGIRDPEWFNLFYENIDLIIAPNINGVELKGSFDGFPTTACIDAGLRDTAIFCTDPLNLNVGYFEDGKEIVIIPHDSSKIVNMVEYYYENPTKLADLAINGRKRILDLFSYEKQLMPRINLLKDVILSSDQVKVSEKQTDTLPEKMQSPDLLKKIKYYLHRGKYSKLLKYSGFFDVSYYLNTNPDVARAMINPYHHYLLYGAYEGRNPSIYFDSEWYLRQNPDVQTAGINPLVHYLLFGQFEGRKPKQSDHQLI